MVCVGNVFNSRGKFDIEYIRGCFRAPRMMFRRAPIQQIMRKIKGAVLAKWGHLMDGSLPRGGTQPGLYSVHGGQNEKVE